MEGDLKIIKQRIFDDETIKNLLEELGCPTIQEEQHGRWITAQLPPQFNSKNRRSIQIKNNESLTGYIRSRGISGDLFTVVAYILYDAVTKEEFNAKLNDTKKWICQTLGYDEYIKYDASAVKPKKKASEWNSWLKDIKKKRSKEMVIHENRSYNESILQEYIIRPVLWWYNEGLSLATQTEFEVGFCLRTKRIIFPVRNKDGRLIGVKGRYVGDDEYTLDHMKYLYVEPCNKSIELFNLHRALPYILEQKEVIVVEGAKTCMFLHQWGYRNVVSIEGDKLTPAQERLLKSLGLDIHFIFVWDKDKSEKEVLEQIEPFKHRICSYIFDNDDVLGSVADENGERNKFSPCDKGREAWEQLYEEYQKTV